MILRASRQPHRLESMESGAAHVLLGSYLALMLLAIAWLHRDLLILSFGLGPVPLGWI